ncbi:MAG: ABC transporter substrate-binding protein [Alphaproteobacteria bacterium]
MRKIALLATVFGAVGFAGSAQALDEFTLQLKWVTQAQFAGYYYALEHGYYEEEGLDVTINPGGPDVNPIQVLIGGGADATVEWLGNPLATREAGTPIVNIAQIYNRSGLGLTCPVSTGIEKPEDLAGHKVGTWFFGNEYPTFAFISNLGLTYQGDNPDVEVIKVGFNVDPLLNGEVDCITTMTYNEYYQILQAGFAPEDLRVFQYEDYDASVLEDGLYTLESSIADPAMNDKLVRFVRASIRGWADSTTDQQGAVDAVVENDETGLSQSMDKQVYAMEQVAKLVEPGAHGVGYLDPAAFDRSVDVLLIGGGDAPVITQRPEGAYTHEIFDAAVAGLQ